MNQESTTLLAALVGLFAVIGAGYKIRKERQRLRQLVAILGEDESDLVHSLEELAMNGRLAPATVT